MALSAENRLSIRHVTTACCRSFWDEIQDVPSFPAGCQPNLLGLAVSCVYPAAFQWKIDGQYVADVCAISHGGTLTNLEETSGFPEHSWEVTEQFLVSVIFVRFCFSSNYI